MFGRVLAGAIVAAIVTGTTALLEGVTWLQALALYVATGSLTTIFLAALHAALVWARSDGAKKSRRVIASTPPRPPRGR